MSASEIRATFAVQFGAVVADDRLEPTTSKDDALRERYIRVIHPNMIHQFTSIAIRRNTFIH